VSKAKAAKDPGKGKRAKGSDDARSAKDHSAKSSKSRGRKARGSGDSDPAAVHQSVIQGPAGSPAGQRLYDMPYSAAAPRLINPELGLHNLVTRAGHNAGYTIDVTLLDAPDHRLIRCGLLLAHRVLDGRGEWYLGSSSWQPMLPEELVEPMGQADLPESFVELIRPFRRRATVGPVAALTCERREFALRDDSGHTLALLRDDKVTVRRGGLTTARFREVMLTPTATGLTEEQSAHVAYALANAGATQVPAFPPLCSRLGAPATGPTDFPVPQRLDPDSSFGQFVSHLLATRLRQVLEADLRVRTDSPGAEAELAAHFGQLRSELQGLSSVVDVAWMEDLDEELEWVVEQAQLASRRASGRGEEPATGTLKQRLRGERYLTLLDRLVTATRAPQVGNASTIRAAEVLSSLVNEAQSEVQRSAAALQVSSPAEQWAAAGVTFDSLFRITEVARHLLPKRVERLRHRLGVASQLLGEAAKHDRAAQNSRDRAASSSAEEAFALGRAYEHELDVARSAREAFVRRWVKTAKKLE
jgi:hypothetical protein